MEMHNIQGGKQQVFCQICMFVQTYSERSNYVNHPLTQLSEINQKLANPLSPPCKKKIRNGITIPSPPSVMIKTIQIMEN